MGCIFTDCSGAMSPGPRAHYPSIPRYRKRTSPEAARKAKGSRRRAGMTCAASAGSVDKAGIHEAAVDVLNNTGLNEDKISETIEDAGFEAKLIKQEAVCRQEDKISDQAKYAGFEDAGFEAQLIKQEANDKSRQVCGIIIKFIESIRETAETLKHFLGFKT